MTIYDGQGKWEQVKGAKKKKKKCLTWTNDDCAGFRLRSKGVRAAQLCSRGPKRGGKEEEEEEEIQKDTIITLE